MFIEKKNKKQSNFFSKVRKIAKTTDINKLLPAQVYISFVMLINMSTLRYLFK